MAASQTSEELTIDQLAQRTGMTVRNIRAHQSRGLLPPPSVRGRTGYYGEEHIARIELIREMQEEGYNLELIRKLIEGGGSQSAALLRFTKKVRQAWVEEEPEIVDAAELAQAYESTDLEVLERGVKLGVLVPLGDGRFEAISPSLIAAGSEIVGMGLEAKEALDVLARVRRQADSVARAFTDVFLEVVWKPFDEAGRPEERWEEVGEVFDRMRPLASEVLLAMFQIAMDDVVEREFGREFAREPDSAAAGRSKRSRRR
jgi:DNA-binding transcriptional MerR regulator